MATRRFLTLALVAAVATCVLGCAARGPLYGTPAELEAGTSEIVVYRLDRFVLAAATLVVHLDGKEVARLRNAGFASIPTSPGNHELELRPPTPLHLIVPINMRAVTRPGARQYFRFEPSTYFNDLVPVSESEALDELRELRRSE